MAWPLPIRPWITGWDAVTSLLPRWRLTGVSWRLKASNATFSPRFWPFLSISRRIGVGGMKR